MSIFAGWTEIKDVYLGDSKLKEVYVWSTMVRPMGRLPREYQEVEYIQSTWIQRIDTWVSANTNTKAEIKLNSQYINESAIFWARWSLNWYFLMFFNSYIRWHSASEANISCSLNTDYTIQTENWKVTINWTAYTNTPSSSILTWYNIGLFATWNQAQAYTRWRFKCYYFKILNWPTLIRDFVPCYRKSDGVIGLYDLVNNQFYTNSGSGAFIKWPNV